MVHLVKAVVFPVAMYGCENWTVKKSERWRIDAFELWCWRRLLRVPWTARRYNQSILKISPGCSSEGLMLKLKLQYFGHLMWRVDSLEKTLMLEGLGAGGEGDDRGWDGWMASLTRWTWVWVNSSSWWWTGRPGVLRFMGSQSRTWLSAWTKLKNYIRLKEQGDNRNQWIQNGGRSLGFCVSLCILNFILKVMSSSSRCVGCVVYLCEREWGEKRCYNIYIFKVNWSMNWKMQVQKKKDQLGSYHDTSFYTITMLRMGDG